MSKRTSFSLVVATLVVVVATMIPNIVARAEMDSSGDGAVPAENWSASLRNDDNPGPARNIARSLNYTDGTDAAEFAWQVEFKTGRVHATNWAHSRARCSDCRTNAVALQIVVGSSIRGSVVANNNAKAVNVRCDACDTAAYAFQFIVVSDADLWLSYEGTEQLASLEAALGALVKAGRTPSDIGTDLQVIAEQVLKTLNEELRISEDHALISGASADAPPTAPFEIRFTVSQDPG